MEENTEDIYQKLEDAIKTKFEEIIASNTKNKAQEWDTFTDVFFENNNY